MGVNVLTLNKYMIMFILILSYRKAALLKVLHLGKFEVLICHFMGNKLIVNNTSIGQFDSYTAD